MNVNYVKPVVQVFAKSSFFYFIFKISVCSCNNPYINIYSFLTADPFKCAFLQNTKNFYLYTLIYFANFIKKNRTFMSKLKTPFYKTVSASKSSLFMSEKFAFQKSFAQSRTVNFYALMLFPRRKIMYCICDNFFSYTAFTCN